MKKHPTISSSKFRYYGLCTALLAGFLIFTSISASSQYYRKKSDRGRNGKKNNQYGRNIVWLEGLGSNQVIGAKYERILMFGTHFSMRFDLGITPFVLDEKYNFIAGRSITPISGMGFYLHFNPGPIRIGLGCSVLHDIFFDGIPEVTSDTTGTYSDQTYRARVMPFAVIEFTIQDHWTIRAGYTPIIDPPNESQKELYFTNLATIGVGYKFGR